MKKIILSLSLCSIVSLSAVAQGRIFPVLEANADVRAAAMGNTTMGNSTQQFVYTNPAAFLFSEKKGSVDVGTEIFPEANEGRMMQYNLSGAYKIDEKRAAYAGFRYQGGITVPATNTTDEKNNIKPHDFTIDLGYAFKVTPEIAVYTTGSYINSNVGNKTHAWAFSFGASYQKQAEVANLPSTITVGARLIDLGKAVKYNDTGLPYSLPTSVALGGDWQVNFTPKHAITYALSTRIFTPKDGKETLVGTGFEYTYNKMLSARLGYQFADKCSDLFTMGIGGTYAGFQLNITYCHATAQSGINTMLIGVGYAF